MVKVLPRSGRIAAALLGTVLAAAGTMASSAAAGAVTTGGRSGALPAGVPAVPSPGHSSRLNGVFCPSATSCWAVGTYYNGRAELEEALRWNGTKWSRVTVPSPGGTGPGDFSRLDAVHCATASACRAVGSAKALGGSELNQALRWDGSTWSAG
jgi:hypothetical protein